MKPWHVTHSEYVIETPYMSLRRDSATLPDGSTVPDYYVVEERDYGMVFALTKAHELVMVRQYKHGIGKIMLELPAGFFDDEDDNPAAGCMREFREETGYDAPHYTLIGSHVRHPTRNTNRGHLVVATGAHPATGQHLDALENIEVVLLPIEQAFDKVRAGEVDAVGTVASMFMAWDYLKREGKV
ncbi:MAG: NUDIX hydrolase [Chloroflexota bacterium]